MKSDKRAWQEFTQLLKEPYCDLCGRRCVYTAVHRSYSRETGEKLYNLVMMCPAYNKHHRCDWTNGLLPRYQVEKLAKHKSQDITFKERQGED